ncbi:collagen alpha-2(I) chain-like [Balaenoptera musculus]|uniref:Collagen alpha-2(I) chain-like n=1 Tax=Balaenoptera musculus TaxID=9771 RepID=A0A8B8VPL2_BALMU|nr:collagen alpha-2(I) chain-like [Balaenoptera musculus]
MGTVCSDKANSESLVPVRALCAVVIKVDVCRTKLELCSQVSRTQLREHGRRAHAPLRPAQAHLGNRRAPQITAGRVSRPPSLWGRRGQPWPASVIPSEAPILHPGVQGTGGPRGPVRDPRLARLPLVGFLWPALCLPGAGGQQDLEGLPGTPTPATNSSPRTKPGAGQTLPGDAGPARNSGFKQATCRVLNAPILNLGRSQQVNLSSTTVLCNPPSSVGTRERAEGLRLVLGIWVSEAVALGGGALGACNPCTGVPIKG